MDSKIKQTLDALFADNKGILAMDESIRTCNKRFEKLGIDQTTEKRRQYRELLVTTPDLNRYIGGAILSDETIHQSLKDGRLMTEVLKKANIVPGIKVDKGTVPLAGFRDEKVTEGLDGLRERLTEYVALGAKFAKWRAVIRIDQTAPTAECIRANMHILARYAALCQEAHLVPIVEPEVLMDGEHTMERCSEVSKVVWLTLFNELRRQRVHIEGIILKANMVLPGKAAYVQNTVNEVADATVHSLLDIVPASVPAIAFLSGGQASEIASERLNAMHRRYKGKLPWKLTFSFSRALQNKAMELWGGSEANMHAAQEALLLRAKCNHAAVQGKYSREMEKEEAVF